MTLKRYNASNIALSRKERFFVVPETSYGAIAEPANTDLVIPIDPSNWDQEPDLKKDKAAHATRSKRKMLLGMLKHGTGSLKTHMYVSGTAGTAPPQDRLLNGGMGNKIARAADTVQAAPAPTTTTFLPGTPANFSVGQPVLVDIGNPAHQELALITAIDAVTNVVTVAPAFSAAPVATANIYAAVGYTLADELPSYSVWQDFYDEVFVYLGTVWDKISVVKKPGEDVELTMGSGFQRVIRCGTDTLYADVASGAATVVTVQDGRKFDVGARFNLSDGTSTETKLIVTGKALNAGAGPTNPYLTDLTVTRGTGAQAWTAANGIDVYPWIPAGVESGTVVMGHRGTMVLNGAAMNVLSGQVDMDNKVVFHEDEAIAQDYVLSYATPGERDLKPKLEVFFRQSDLFLFGDALTITSEAVMLPSYAMDANGNPKAGYVCALVLPQTTFKIPKITDKSGERVLTIDADPYYNAGNDDLAIWFL